MSLNVDKITAYVSRLIDGIPGGAMQQEPSLSNVAYFCVNCLSMLGTLDKVIPPQKREQLIEWVYATQTEPPQSGGFRHSNCNAIPSDRVSESHLTMTFSALGTLLILGDDLSRVDRIRILETIQQWQQPNGAFIAHELGSEVDMRNVFTAVIICRILHGLEYIDKEKVIQFVIDSQTYEGGFAHEPGGEAHGGATYCAVGALTILGAIDRVKDYQALVYWLSQRQIGGFNGRTEKFADTCYSFWIGSPLKMIGLFDEIVDKEDLQNFIFSNYVDEMGFRPCCDTDEIGIVHTHFSLAGLSFLGYPGVNPIDPVFGFTPMHPI